MISQTQPHFYLFGVFNPLLCAPGAITCSRGFYVFVIAALVYSLPFFGMLFAPAIVKVRDLHYRWRKEHPEEWKAIHKRRYYKDVEATRARDRARRAKKWIENPEQIKMWLRLANHRRKARKLNAKGECSKVQFLAKCDYHGWRCVYCKIELTLATVTLDHRQPLSKGNGGER